MWRHIEYSTTTTVRLAKLVYHLSKIKTYEKFLYQLIILKFVQCPILVGYHATQ